MRFEVTRDSRIAFTPTPVTMFPDHEDGIFYAMDPVEGLITAKQAGFTNIPPAAIDALEAGDDSLVRRHAVIISEGLHYFVDCGVAVECWFGAASVSSLIEAPGI